MGATEQEEAAGSAQGERRDADRDEAGRSGREDENGSWSGWPEAFFAPMGLMRRALEESFGGVEPYWWPRLDVFEREGQLVVRADLPGMEKDDITVELTEEGLLIHGERQHHDDARESGFRRSEVPYGSFRRLLPLPRHVDVEHATASFRNGVLEVCVGMPPGQQRKRRKIPVTAGGAEPEGEPVVH